MRMAISGRRNRLGGLHGPMNEENLNGSSPCMLAAQRCKSDVQLPYRLPICKETLSAACGDDCVDSVDEQATCTWEVDEVHHEGGRQPGG